MEKEEVRGPRNLQEKEWHESVASLLKDEAESMEDRLGSMLPLNAYSFRVENSGNYSRWRG